MSIWPDTLPPPELSSYTTSDEFNIIRTEMESGPPRQARRSAHYLTTGRFSLTLSKTQLETFQSAIAASNYGADWITDCPIDSGRGNKSHRIRMLQVSREVLLPEDGLYKLTVQFETDEHN